MRAALLSLLFLLAASPAAERPDPPRIFALTGATVVTAPGKTVAGATVVLRDPAELDTGAQRELFQWLDAHEGRVQVVSVARAPLYPLVAEGEFSEALFYRLNIVTMHAATVG